MFQKTIKSAFTLNGVGIHSGNPVQLTVKPAEANHGIVFVRTDKQNLEIPAHISAIAQGERATVLSQGGASIETPEHFLAACYALGVDTLRVEVGGPELPIMDGSALEFVRELHNAGIKQLDQESDPIIISKSIKVQEPGKKLHIMPHDSFKVSYLLEYDHPVVQTQFYSIDVEKDFEKEIAPARTYGFEHEIQALYDKGLAKGGSLENALVIGEQGYLNPPRFTDELVRHKILDIIGDFALLSRPLKAHIIGVGSGHAMNAEGAKLLTNS